MTPGPLDNGEIDGSTSIIVTEPGDGVPTGAVVDLGPASVASLRALDGLAPGVVASMDFGTDQLPELALAAVRGVRVVRAEDPAAAAKVCRMVEALRAPGDPSPRGGGSLS